jgi:hypothetical protein
MKQEGLVVTKYLANDNKTVFEVVKHCGMEGPCGFGNDTPSVSIGGRWGPDRRICIKTGEQAYCGNHKSNKDIETLKAIGAYIISV